MRAATLLCSVLVTLAAGCRSARPAQDPGATDALLFALPSWCGKQAKKRGWAAWAEDRSRPPTGAGVCGVRFPDRDPDADAGVCVELVDHRVARAYVGAEGERTSSLDAFTSEAIGRAWAAVPSGDDVVLVRLEGGVISARDRDGKHQLDGPCFYR